MFQVRLLAFACLVGAGVGLVASRGTGDQVNAAPNKYACGSINCTGTVNGYQTGTTPPLAVSCDLNGVGNVPACVYTGNANDDCQNKGSNNCTGTVTGNPLVNCYKPYPGC
jgi:hypothetical protein